MMENYEFIETSSRDIEVDGEQMRLVNFRGRDNSSIPNEELNVDGRFTMPIMEYFQAGMEGNRPEVIRQYVVGRFTPKE